MLKQGPHFSLRDKRFFEISECEITRIDCIFIMYVIGNQNAFQIGTPSLITLFSRPRVEIGSRNTQYTNVLNPIEYFVLNFKDEY